MCVCVCALFAGAHTTQCLPPNDIGFTYIFETKPFYLLFETLRCMSAGRLYIFASLGGGNSNIIKLFRCFYIKYIFPPTAGARRTGVE